LNLNADTPEIPILRQLRKIFPSVEVLQKAYKNVSTLNTVVSPDPLSFAPSTPSAMKTPDPQTSEPSVLLVETEGISEKQEGLLMPLNKEVKEISKQNTTLICFADQTGTTTTNHL
jgi:hypothetical protein